VNCAKNGQDTGHDTVRILNVIISFVSVIMMPITISRVNQFDAARLDVEMSAMLKEQLVKVFSLMNVLSSVII
jgi:hypothetical protein